MLLKPLKVYHFPNGVLMASSIVKVFSEHGTLVQPDTLDYIMSKENPEE